MNIRKQVVVVVTFFKFNVFKIFKIFLTLLIQSQSFNELANVCHSSAESVAKGQIVPEASAGLLCMLEMAISMRLCLLLFFHLFNFAFESLTEKCSCVPMLVVLWTLQSDLDRFAILFVFALIYFCISNSSFLRRFNASTICTVGEFDQCIRPYIEFAIAPAWFQYPVPEDAPSEFRDGVDTCRK